MDYTRPGEIKNPWVQGYVLSIFESRDHITLYELEHPKYETDEDYAHIVEAWVQNRAWWTQEHKARGEFLPKPKRRPGRPANAEALAAKQAKEAERAERARLKEENKIERARSLEKRVKSSGTFVLTFRVPEPILLGILQVKGDLPIADCVVQLLEHALGPLAKTSMGNGA